MKLDRLTAAVFVLVLVSACGREGPPEPGPIPDLDDGDISAPPPDEDDAPAEPLNEDDAPPATSLPAHWREEPGDLLSGSNTIHASDGVIDPSVIVPEMRFPLAEGPAFANSQILSPGGGGYWGGEWPSPGGSENDAANFDYPWRDNFCETRKEDKHITDLCPGGRAHKGQDLRPATCENAVHWLVAPEDGHISWVGSISVNIMGHESGMKYKFLHVQKPLPDWVEVGAPVTKGQPFARVSDRLSSTSRATTVHVHFEIHGAAEIDGALHNGALPPYSSLVEAYLDLTDVHPDQIAPVDPVPLNQCLTPQWP